MNLTNKIKIVLYFPIIIKIKTTKCLNSTKNYFLRINSIRKPNLLTISNFYFFKENYISQLKTILLFLSKTLFTNIASIFFFFFSPLKFVQSAGPDFKFIDNSNYGKIYISLIISQVHTILSQLFLCVIFVALHKVI